MVISAPENVVRALAAAPQTQIRDITLAALGFTPDLKAISPEQRRVAESDLQVWFDAGDSTQGEIPI